jgi:L-histidine N-alpha-methyltransferase
MANKKLSGKNLKNLEVLDADHSFYHDIIKGLTSRPKYLDSKYFYDAKGDGLFQQLMHSSSYYLTRCELEIFKERSAELIAHFPTEESGFDLIEMGAGDALKSSFLLKQLISAKANFTYYPIDISENIIETLTRELPEKFPYLKINGMNGEYFEMLKEVSNRSGRSKVLLFLGSNIGNMSLESSRRFCADLAGFLSSDDLVIMGFDLKKDPEIILEAYNDPQGITRDFNLNLLQRINKELNADFNLAQFKHYPIYNPESGACQSYLVSLNDQYVSISGETIFFKAHETIYMEVSQKFTVEQTDALAIESGFLPIAHLYDSKKWFLDAVWKFQ